MGESVNMDNVLTNRSVAVSACFHRPGGVLFGLIEPVDTVPGMSLPSGAMIGTGVESFLKTYFGTSFVMLFVFFCSPWFAIFSAFHGIVHSSLCLLGVHDL